MKAEEIQKFYARRYGEWAKWLGTPSETYDWGEPPQTTWGWPNEKGKGQGAKGEPHLKTDPGD